MNMNKISIKSISAVASRGLSIDEIWQSVCDGQKIDDHSLASFKPAKYLANKRNLKAVSSIDSYGLVAIDLLKKNIGEEFIGSIDPFKKGVFVGATSSSTDDNRNYLDIHREALANETMPAIHAFGDKCMTARPNTLLIGLPNNVLCYGSIIMDAMGPNSNYVSSEISSFLALEQAANALDRGDIDAAIAGGFSSHLDAVDTSLFRQRGMGEIPFANGASFAWIERQDQNTDDSSIAQIAGCKTASSLNGPVGDRLEDAPIIERLVQSVLADADIDQESVGFVFLNDTGFDPLDQAELEAISNVFGDRPVYLTTIPTCGNMCEASGLIEIALARKIYDNQMIPDQLKMAGPGNTQIDFDSKKYGLILRLSPWGEFAVLLIKLGDKK